MRFPRYQSEFLIAAEKIYLLKNDPSNMELLLNIQRFLFRKIVSEEAKVKRIKRARARLNFVKKNRRLSKSDSKDLKGMIKGLDSRLRDRKALINTWKFFGDGIANIYQSEYSLKHFYYDDDYNVKESAGDISGKEGFKQEWRILRAFIDNNLPAVLSDLTNIIRIGDVCALGLHEPFPLEIKKKLHSNPGSRVGRQIKQIEKLNSFFKDDFYPSYKNGFDAYRVAIKLDEIDYRDEINHLFSTALECGYSSKEVENGLTYFCVQARLSEEQAEAAFKSMSKIGYGTSTLVNEITPDESWGVAYPFTLSLENTNLVAFIQNDVLVYILVDLDVIRSEFLTHGLNVKILMDGLHAFQFSIHPDDLSQGAFRVSEQYFLRQLVGFKSIKWLVNENAKHLLELDADFVGHLRANITDENLVIQNRLLQAWSEDEDALMALRKQKEK